jgi:hypothetical protein
VARALYPGAVAAYPHTRIPLNRGICGAAASQRLTAIVDDVNSDPRYLACSLETKSEIVVPIMRDGRVLGLFGFCGAEMVKRPAYGPTRKNKYWVPVRELQLVWSMPDDALDELSEPASGTIW